MIYSHIHTVIAERKFQANAAHPDTVLRSDSYLWWTLIACAAILNCEASYQQLVLDLPYGRYFLNSVMWYI